MAQHRIRLGNAEVDYQLRRSARRRTIGLKIDQAGLSVSVPHRLPRQAWEDVLREKSGWVLDKLMQMQNRMVPSIRWCDGESLPFLGRSVELLLEQGGARTKPFLDGALLRVPLPDPEDAARVAEKVVAWYRSQALECFLFRVELLSRQLGVEAKQVALSSARGRWGSCNSRGIIRLNWRLIKAPLAVIDYVVSHELAHLVEMNHSPAFWQVVARLCPEYGEQRALLRLHGPHYHAF